MASFIYVIFGSCENITIGPTAIMATMIQPLVEKYGADIAILITFLKGCIIALLGIFHLGMFTYDIIHIIVNQKNKKNIFKKYIILENIIQITNIVMLCISFLTIYYVFILKDFYWILYHFR